MRPRPFARLLALALALVAGSAEARPVVVFGDSLAIGVAAQLRVAGRQVIDLGRVSWGLFHRDWPQRIAVLRAHAASAEAVVIFVGTNDHGIRSDRFRARLAEMRAAVRPGVPVIWVGQPVFCRPDLVSGSQAVDAALRSAAAIARDTYVAPPGGCGESLRARDGVHFTPRGYREIARQLASAV